MRNQQPKVKRAKIGWTAVLFAFLMFALSCTTTRLTHDDEPIGPYHPVIEPGMTFMLFHLINDDRGIVFDSICAHTWVYIAIPPEEQYESPDKEPSFPCVCVKCHIQSMCK